MIMLASVDLPEPFGLMRAWILPFSTLRSRPLRIAFSPALPCRFRISRPAISLRNPVEVVEAVPHGDARGAGRNGGNGVFAHRELDEVRERRALERLDDPAL